MKSEQENQKEHEERTRSGTEDERTYKYEWSVLVDISIRGRSSRTFITRSFYRPERLTTVRR